MLFLFLFSGECHSLSKIINTTTWYLGYIEGVQLNYIYLNIMDNEIIFS